MPSAPPSLPAPDPYLPPGDPTSTTTSTTAREPVAAPPLDGWSVASLVTALLGLVPVGLVAAVVGLSRTRAGRRRGRPLAVAGLVVSLLAGVVQAVALSLLVPAWPEVRAGFDAALAEPAEGTGPTGEVVQADTLAVGTCFDEPSTDVFYDVETVPCDQPHDAEVVGTVELEDRAWPGDDPLLDEAYDACLVELTDLLLAAGVDGDDLDPWVFTPTRESWVLFDDREGTCVVYPLDGEPFTGPVLP